MKANRISLASEIRVSPKGQWDSSVTRRQAIAGKTSLPIAKKNTTKPATHKNGPFVKLLAEAKGRKRTMPG